MRAAALLAALLAGCGGRGAREALAPPPPAQPPPAGAAAPDLAEWVRRLGASAFAEREAAEQALREAGEAADPLLEEAARSTDPEVAARAASALARIRRPPAFFVTWKGARYALAEAEGRLALACEQGGAERWRTGMPLPDGRTAAPGTAKGMCLKAAKPGADPFRVQVAFCSRDGEITCSVSTADGSAQGFSWDGLDPAAGPEVWNPPPPRPRPEQVFMRGLRFSAASAGKDARGPWEILCEDAKGERWRRTLPRGLWISKMRPVPNPPEGWGPCLEARGCRILTLLAETGDVVRQRRVGE